MRVTTTFRGVLKRFAPPIITDALHASRPLSSWEAAKAASGSYAADLVNRFRAERAAHTPTDGLLLISNILYLTAKALNTPDLRVTDFGGACGDLGRDFLGAFPKASYTVVENPTLVALLPAATGGVHFTSTLPAECDLFFSSSTLQYLDDPVAVLNTGFKSARRAVVLTRNSFCDTEIFRVQKSRLFNNGRGPIPAGYKNVIVTYPHRTLKESAVREVAKSHGFRLIARIEEQSGVIPYRGIVYGGQLAYLRDAL